MPETTNKVTIRSLIDEWLRDMRNNDEFRPEESEKTEIIQEHPLPHHTELTYTSAINKFLKMLEENGISDQDDISSLAMEHFIQFPAWVASYREKTKKGKLRGLSKSTRKLYGNGVESFRMSLSINGHLHASSEDRDRLVAARKQFFKLPHRLPKAADEGAVQACLDQVGKMPWEDKIKKRNAAILYIMVNSGLRIHEVCKLKIGDLQLSARQGTIIGKGNKESVFKFVAQDVKRLRDYWQERGWGNDLEDPVFAAHDKSTGTKNEKHRHLTTSAVYQMIQDVAAMAGVKVWPHAFRHEFVIRAYRRTKNIIFTQGLARHSSIQTTKDYIPLVDEEQERLYREHFENEEDEGEVNND